MRFGTTVSLRQEDLEKLEYLASKHNLEMSKGISGVVRLAIQKAFAHEKEIEIEEESKKEKGLIAVMKEKIW